MLIFFNLFILLFMHINSEDDFIYANALQREETTKFYRGTKVIYYILQNIIKGELNFDILSIEKIRTIKYAKLYSEQNVTEDMAKNATYFLYSQDKTPYSKANNGIINGFKYNIFENINEDENITHFVLQIVISQYDGMFFIYSRLRGNGGKLGIAFGIVTMGALLIMFEIIKRKLDI